MCAKCEHRPLVYVIKQELLEYNFIPFELKEYIKTNFHFYTEPDYYPPSYIRIESCSLDNPLGEFSRIVDPYTDQIVRGLIQNDLVEDVESFEEDMDIFTGVMMLLSAKYSMFTMFDDGWDK